MALRRLADVNPDLLITDIYLPTKSGFDLARFMKSQAGIPRHSDHLRGRSGRSSSTRQDAKNAGADAILRKPFEASALLGAVQKLLEQRSACDQRRTTRRKPPCARPQQHSRGGHTGARQRHAGHDRRTDRARAAGASRRNRR